MLVFISDDNEIIGNRVKQAIEQETSVIFNRISNGADACQQKNFAVNTEKGVFLLDRRFARGFDLKFATDAFVVVLALKNDVRASEIEQMIGRASRCNGVQQGCVHVVSDMKVGGGTATIDWIKSKDSMRDQDQGPELVKALMKTWTDLKTPEKRHACTIFGDQRWRMSLTTFFDTVKNTGLQNKLETALE